MFTYDLDFDPWPYLKSWGLGDLSFTASSNPKKYIRYGGKSLGLSGTSPENPSSVKAEGPENKVNALSDLTWTKRKIHSKLRSGRSWMAGNDQWILGV